MVEEFRSSLAGRFWVRVSHELAVKLSGATVIWRLCCLLGEDVLPTELALLASVLLPFYSPLGWMKITSNRFQRKSPLKQYFWNLPCSKVLEEDHVALLSFSIEEFGEFLFAWLTKGFFIFSWSLVTSLEYYTSTNCSGLFCPRKWLFLFCVCFCLVFLQEVDSPLLLFQKQFLDLCL